MSRIPRGAIPEAAPCWFWSRFRRWRPVSVGSLPQDLSL